MTLRQDCELWATFDSEDVDPSRGIVRDRSGKGRTLESSGGPTYGQSSPVGEAVGLDGTDDQFNFNADLSFAFGTGAEFTQFGIINPNRLDDFDVCLSATDNLGGKNAGWGTYVALGGLVLDIQNEDGFDQLAKVSLPEENRWYRYAAVYSSGEARMIVDDIGTGTLSVDPPAEINLNNYAIGTETNGDRRFFSGEFAFQGLWSRALSDSEIDRLFDMTDRMVSKL